MSQRQPEPAPDQYPTDDEVDAVIVEAGGDAKEDVRMLLVDLDALAHDRNGSVSYGFVYGRLAAAVRGRDR